MRSILAMSSCCLLLAATALAAPRLPSRPASPWEPHEVLILVPRDGGFTADATGRAHARDARLGDALARAGLTHARSLRRSPAGAGLGMDAWRLTSDRADLDPRAAAAAIRASGAVIAAAPNLHLSLHLVPNDPYLTTQWHLGTTTAGVRARQGWSLATGSPNVVIGIMDTGVDLGHEDLASRIWTNPGEIAGNSLDDDHDGYIDDVHGWDFGDDDNDPNPEPLIDPNVGIDEGWHGTFVAGLAAAAGNNAIGGAGITWGCPILPLKVSNAAGDIPLDAVVSAFDYAIAHHVSVLNMSIGTTDSTAASFFQPLVNAAFNAGIVCVASAGNDGTDALSFPASCDSVLGVAATNKSNTRSSFSNWGPSVDIAAPGEEMFSSIARNYPYDDTSLIFFEYLWGYDDVNPYMYNDGTSFSSPIVAGAAALVRSKFPALGPQQVMRQLVIDGDVVAYDDPIGPRLNIERALTVSLDAGDPATAHAVRLAPVAPDPVIGAARLSFTLPVAGAVTLEVHDILGRRIARLASGVLPAGLHEAVWDGRDARGLRAAPGVYLARLVTPGEACVRRFVLLR